MALEDYKDIVGAAAGFVTFCQFFSGVFLCIDIYKSGSTNKTPVMPFLIGSVLSILFYQYGFIINDPAMGTVNIFGLALNVCYLTFYYLWTEDSKKPGFYKQIFKGIVFVSILLGYAKIEDPEKVGFRFGVILTALLMLAIALPLFSLGEVIKTKSTETLPFPMIVSGFVVSAHWLLYGIIIKNNFVIFQNFIGFALALIQLMLFVIYPRSAKDSKKVK